MPVLHYSSFVQKNEDKGNEVSLQCGMWMQRPEFLSQYQKLIFIKYTGNPHHSTSYDSEVSKWFSYSTPDT
jgi:hypothetical protein